MGVCVCAHISLLFHGHSCACLYSPPRVAMFAHIGFFFWVVVVVVVVCTVCELFTKPNETTRRGDRRCFYCMVAG